MTKFNWRQLAASTLQLIDFVLLISLYVVFQVGKRVYLRLNRGKSQANPPFYRLYQKLVTVLDQERVGSISRINLIEISLKNMASKKTRTWITMGGMALGIGFIVLLVSLGYGLEKLVVSRVARLEELRQADIVPGLTDDLSLSDKTISAFQQIPGITEVIPVIASVGKINYNNSQSDMAVYGVTTKYLEESAISPSSGQIFQNNDLTVSSTRPEPTVLGEESPQGLGPFAISYTLESGFWYRVRDGADPESQIIGYTRSTGTSKKGSEIRGTKYTWDGQVSDRWIRAAVPLWDKGDCTGEDACEDGEYLPQLASGAPVIIEGYLAEIATLVEYSPLAVDTAPEPVVLGESTDGSLPVVEIASLSAQKKLENIETVPVGGASAKELVINRAALTVLSLSEGEAVGTKLKLTFFIVDTGRTAASTRTQSQETEYTIIGVIPDETTPVLYVPFVDLRSLGVENYSQIKVIVGDQSDLPQVRTSIESSGYGTISVVDTIGQIDNLFTSIRAFLATLGVVALSVAALGMFNTLTVSLLERTHEVGLMKAIGMKSSEVKELFMTESMIMGFFGGVLGLILGVLVGYAISLLLSLFSLTKGAGFLNVTHVPIGFSLLILALSLLVGIGTGYIPARRATRISALDALRYE